MSVPQKIDDIRRLARSAVRATYLMLKNLLSKNNDKDNKRAGLLSYWIKDYCNYIAKEDSFNASHLLKYKRGNIVQAEFGYRIGRELGGRHFAIVIDNHNDFNSETITVVPLISLKQNYKTKPQTFILEKGIYTLFSEKMDKKIEEINEKIKDLSEKMEEAEKDFEEGKIKLDEYKKFNARFHKANKELKIQISLIRKQINSMSNLKTGSVANVGQVITISKMRITNPRMNKDSLYSIKIKESDLDILNKKLKNLYINSK